MSVVCSRSNCMFAWSLLIWFSYWVVASAMFSLRICISLSFMFHSSWSGGSWVALLSCCNAETRPFVRPRVPSFIWEIWWAESSLVWVTIARSAAFSARLLLTGLLRSMTDWSKMENNIAVSTPPGRLLSAWSLSAFCTLIVGSMYFWAKLTGMKIRSLMVPTWSRSSVGISDIMSSTDISSIANGDV